MQFFLDKAESDLYMGITCPSCCSAATQLIGDISSTNDFAGNSLAKPIPGGQLFECSSCSLYFRYPALPKESLAELYAKGSDSTWAANERIRTDWQLAAELIQRYTNNGDVLDVGCFDGGFLNLLPERYKRFGIEIHPAAINLAQSRGVSVIGNDFYQLAQLNRKFDAVVAIDVIEHHSDPRCFLQSLEKITKKGGVVIIATGNTDSPSWRFMKSRYWYCTIAEHISFINPKWCAKVSVHDQFVLKQINKYSHSSYADSWSLRLREAGKNIFFTLFPTVAAWLRKQGVGGKEVRRHPELAYHPPVWLTAKDHFMAIYQKIGDSDERQ